MHSQGNCNGRVPPQTIKDLPLPPGEEASRILGNKRIEEMRVEPLLPKGKTIDVLKKLR